MTEHVRDELDGVYAALRDAGYAVVKRSGKWLLIDERQPSREAQLDKLAENIAAYQAIGKMLADGWRVELEAFSGRLTAVASMGDTVHLIAGRYDVDKAIVELAAMAKEMMEGYVESFLKEKSALRAQLAALPVKFEKQWQARIAKALQEVEESYLRNHSIHPSEVVTIFGREFWNPTEKEDQ